MELEAPKPQEVRRPNIVNLESQFVMIVSVDDVCQVGIIKKKLADDRGSTDHFIVIFRPNRPM